MYRMVLMVFFLLIMIICTLTNVNIVSANDKKVEKNKEKVKIEIGISLQEKQKLPILSQMLPQQEFPPSGSINDVEQDGVNTEIRVNEEMVSPTPNSSNLETVPPNSLQESPSSDSIQSPDPEIGPTTPVGQTSSSPIATQSAQDSNAQNLNNTQNFTDDESNYYQEFKLDQEIAFFLITIAFSCFLMGIGLINFDSSKLNSFSQKGDFDYPTVR